METWRSLMLNDNLDTDELNALRVNIVMLREVMTVPERQEATEILNRRREERIHQHTHSSEPDPEFIDNNEPDIEPEPLPIREDMIKEYLTLEREARRSRRSSGGDCFERLRQLRERLTTHERNFVDIVTRERRQEREPQSEPLPESDEEPEDEEEPMRLGNVTAVRNLVPDVFNARHVQRHGILPHTPLHDVEILEI